MLSRTACPASSIFGSFASVPIVSNTALPLTRYFATQDFAPPSVIHKSKPGKCLSKKPPAPKRVR
jgi:hypothetical protein